MQKMEEKGLKMVDLYDSMDLKTINEYIQARLQGYMGHLGRYGEDRIEAQMLRAALVARPNFKPHGGRRSLRQTYWVQIAEIMKLTGLEPGEWMENWKIIAGTNAWHNYRRRHETTFARSTKTRQRRS